jgi:tRNA threonylcarbamoyladenosine biosynthesis protein TsaB
MNVLAFDTCFNACSAAIGTCEDGVIHIIAARFEPMATGQAECLLPMISECLAEAKLSMADIGKIAVTTGPGTFTGTRIGISAAKGLALANRTPVAGLSSLHLMARQVALAAPQPHDIGIVIDVRRDEVYMQRFDSTGLVPKTAPALMSVAQASDLTHSSTIFLAGNGAALVAPHDRAQIFSCKGAAEHLPDARYAVDILSTGNLTGIPVSPLYLRAPDAKPSSVPALQRQ